LHNTSSLTNLVQTTTAVGEVFQITILHRFRNAFLKKIHTNRLSEVELHHAFLTLVCLDSGNKNNASRHENARRETTNADWPTNNLHVSL